MSGKAARPSLFVFLFPYSDWLAKVHIVTYKLAFYCFSTYAILSGPILGYRQAASALIMVLHCCRTRV